MWTRQSRIGCLCQGLMKNCIEFKHEYYSHDLALQRRMFQNKLEHKDKGNEGYKKKKRKKESLTKIILFGWLM